MENQKSISTNPILSATSRQFYSRRVPPRQNSNLQVQRVLRVLNSSGEKKAHRKIKTDIREDRRGEDVQNMRKLAMAKLQNSMRREQKEWRELWQAFESFARSSSREVLEMNEINFMLKMDELMKKVERVEEKTERVRKMGQKGRQPKNNVFLDNVRLFKQNELLKDRLSGIDHSSIPEQPNIRTIAKLPSTVFLVQQNLTKTVLSTQSNGLQSELQALRQTNDILREQKRTLQQKITELKYSNENLCEEIVKIRYFNSESKNKFEMWGNIMNMQNEEIISLKGLIAELRHEMGDLGRKYHNVLKRVSSLSNRDHAKMGEITKKNVEVFSEQIQSFQKIRNYFIVRGFYNAAQKKESGHAYMKYMGEKESVGNSQGVKKMPKEYLRYYKPSFYVFLEKYFEYQGVDKQNFDTIDMPVGMKFLTTLRSILDSKYNEYLLSRRVSRQFSSLGVFTLSWLSNFMVDHKTKKREEITTDICFETIGTFYVKLMSPYLNGNWEVITFREFLLQSLTIDDLVFYLKARFALLKGDGMTGFGAFMEVYYVNYVDALVLIQEVVADFDYRKKLEDYLKKTVQFQRKNQLIDAHFILRLLLEYYQFKKTETFSHISKTFAGYLRDRNVTMPFEIFLKIFDYNSFELTLIERVQIYQKAFSLGKGLVNLQNIFTVINEQGFLCKEVEKMFERYPMVRESANLKMMAIIKDEDVEQSFYDLFDKAVVPQTSNLGLEWTKREIAQLNSSTNRTFETMFQKIQLLFELSLFNLKKLFYCKKSKEQDLVMLIPECLDFFKELVKKSIDKKNTLQIIQNFNKKNAAKQILHFYRKKRWINRSYFSIEQHDRSKEKSDQIRKEFTSMIDHLKHKYKYTPKITNERDEQDQY